MSNNQGHKRTPEEIRVQRYLNDLKVKNTIGMMLSVFAWSLVVAVACSVVIDQGIELPSSPSEAILDVLI